MIRVDHLSKQFDATVAVDDISFEIAHGEIVGFLGPNGAGKTTTLRMLTGYLKPTNGSIEMAGLRVDDNPLEFRKRIGYLPELNPLYDDLEVYEYLTFFGHLRSIEANNLKKRIQIVVESCGLGDVVGKDVGQLSKGYKQRLGLALAILHDPEILLLDEPTSGLDPNQIREIRHLIQELQKEKTVVLSTHILQEVQASCNRVLIINRGAIVASGTTEQLQDMVMGKEQIVLEIKGDDQGFSRLIESLPGVETAACKPDTGKQQTVYEIETTGTEDLRERLFSLAVEHKRVIIELHRQHINLEEIFRRLTEGTDD
ncbi:MAG: ATP-binding cassette domain-containing protein [Elusimicrobia bacterium]|nr:ATP-binding cassette domain-containing protein [Elusimicrobiota bacterium]MBD3412459.1 ATP-binding cassette domain-containing protein [Elusimicrobiota bacterium]